MTLITQAECRLFVDSFNEYESFILDYGPLYWKIVASALGKSHGYILPHGSLGRCAQKTEGQLNMLMTLTKPADLWQKYPEWKLVLKQLTCKSSRMGWSNRASRVPKQSWFCPKCAGIFHEWAEIKARNKSNIAVLPWTFVNSFPEPLWLVEKSSS